MADEELSYERVVGLLHPDDRENVRAAITAASRPVDPTPYSIAYRVVHPGGSEHWIEAHGRTYFEGEGETRFAKFLVGTVRDITEQRVSEEALRAERELLRTVFDQAPDDAILITDAERTLTAWNPAAGRITGWTAAEAVGQTADIIFTPEDRAAGGAKQETDTAARDGKATDGRWHVRKDGSRFWGSGTMNALHDPEGRVRGYLKVFRDATARHEETETLAFFDNSPTICWIIPAPSRSSRPLSDAIKFTPKDGKVQVMLERVNSHLEVSIADTGEGIAPDFLPYVFDRFRQQDASTTSKHGGLGLGLAIVKQLVELHGGNIQVKSAGLGQGTTFKVLLPLSVVQPAPDPADPDRRHPQSGNASLPLPSDRLNLAGVKVLVVDDEADTRNLVRRLLQDRGAIVQSVGSAAEAVETLQSQRPDVLILAGFQTHVAKPVEAAELLALVASLAGRVAGN